MSRDVHNIQFQCAASSKGSDVDAAFLPCTSGMEVANSASVTVGTEVVSRTSKLEVVPAIRYSEDRITWGTPAAAGTYISATGWSYTDFTNFTDTERYVQFGVLAKNASGTAVEKGIVRVQLQFKS